MEGHHLERFIEAQQTTYESAFQEIKRGRKSGHWMWFIFPQVAGLGFSETSRYYAISDSSEAAAYLVHPVLGERLIKISEILLPLKGLTAYQIFGSPDDLKLKSCMTLFNRLKNTNPVFEQVLKKYFDGQEDLKALEILGFKH